jgi:hypothetical protein
MQLGMAIGAKHSAFSNLGFYSWNAPFADVDRVGDGDFFFRWVVVVES